MEDCGGPKKWEAVHNSLSFMNLQTKVLFIWQKLDLYGIIFKSCRGDKFLKGEFLSNQGFASLAHYKKRCLYMKKNGPDKEDFAEIVYNMSAGKVSWRYQLRICRKNSNVAYYSKKFATYEEFKENLVSEAPIYGGAENFSDIWKWCTFVIDSVLVSLHRVNREVRIAISQTTDQFCFEDKGGVEIDENTKVLTLQKRCWNTLVREIWQTCDESGVNFQAARVYMPYHDFLLNLGIPKQETRIAKKIASKISA